MNKLFALLNIKRNIFIKTGYFSKPFFQITGEELGSINLVGMSFALTTFLLTTTCRLAMEKGMQGNDISGLRVEK